METLSADKLIDKLPHPSGTESSQTDSEKEDPLRTPSDTLYGGIVFEEASI